MDRGRTCWLAWGLFGLGVVALWSTVGGLVAPLGLLAALSCFASALRSRAAPPDEATSLLGRGGAAAVVLLVVAGLLRPLAGLPLPDIGVLGQYTYLATEIAFGSLAFALLYRTGRDTLRRAVRTIAVIYPLAYVWDWYTLEVGVFAITLRTGVEFAGIPLEEHLFMVVVPALILGVHETLDARAEET